MKIEVLECDWGVAQHDDIWKLLLDVASHIVRELRYPFVETIHVMNLPGQRCPKAFYGGPDATKYEINLTARDRKWSKFAYQFSHEFCHVLSGHDRLRDNPNNWFHEAICELASFFVLRRMAERCLVDPPFAHWSDYSAAPADYAECEARKYQRATPAGSFSAWLRTNECELRQNCYLREKNGVVALRLLPLFEKAPQHGWNAVRRLPVSKGLIHEYIEAWKTDVQDIDHLFVESIGNTLSD